MKPLSIGLEYAQGIVDASLALAAATDILIAAVLSFYLHRRRSGIQRYDD